MVGIPNGVKGRESKICSKIEEHLAWQSMDIVPQEARDRCPKVVADQ